MSVSYPFFNHGQCPECGARNEPRAGFITCENCGERFGEKYPFSDVNNVLAIVIAVAVLVLGTLLWSVVDK